MKHMGQMIGALTVVCMVAGCVEEPPVWNPLTGENKQSYTGKADAADWMDGDPVRLAMRQVESGVPATDYWSLLVTESSEVANDTANHTMGEFQRRGLLLGMEGDTQQYKDHTVRIWRYELGADVRPQRIQMGAITNRLGFKIKGGSTVEFARLFPTEAEANLAKSPTLMALPHDTKSALELPENTVVSIPIESQLAVDVTGRFLTKSAQYSPELLPHVTTSAIGTTSGVRQGTLLIDGQFMLQIIRLHGQRVRVRIHTGTSLGANGNLSLNNLAMARYHFIPSSIVGRARGIKRRVERAKQNVQKMRTANARIKSLRKQFGNKINLVFDHVNPAEENQPNNAIEDWARSTSDVAFDLADTATTLNEVEEYILAHTEHGLSAVLNAWNKHIEPVLQDIKRLSSRTYNLNGGIQLSDEFGRTVRAVADYEFDLSDPTARHAFDRTISGRAIWIDAHQRFSSLFHKKEPFADLTLAETIASTDVTAAHPRVIRHVRALSDLRERHMGIRVSGLWMSAGFEWKQSKNRIDLMDTTGAQSVWEARTWQFQHDSSWIGDNQANSFASGAFVEYGQNHLNGGGYWFNWNRTYPRNVTNPVSRSLSEFINLLGPVGVESGIPSMYDGEHPGKITASLDVVFSEEAMNLLFDREKTPDSLLWILFGELAQTFDNRYGLPLAIAPIRPAGLDQIPGASEACEQVAMHFGGWYCLYFADTFIPALRDAQDSLSPEARLDFLEQFYKAGLFGNPVGSRVLVRYVADLIRTLGASNEISLHASIQNNEDSSESASPSLELGNPEALALIETMGPSGFR